MAPLGHPTPLPSSRQPHTKLPDMPTVSCRGVHDLINWVDMEAFSCLNIDLLIDLSPAAISYAISGHVGW